MAGRESHQKPIFSVIIPTYNRAQLLPRAIDSVLKQTFADFELLIVDDGSTDNTQEVVNRYNDPRVSCILANHAGGAAARNTGAKAAQGKYLTFLDSDDEALPHWLASFADGLTDDAIGIICCGAFKIEERQGQNIITTLLPQNRGPLYYDQTVMFAPGGVFAVHAKLFQGVGGYKETRTAGQHNELSLRLIPHVLSHGYRIDHLSTPLIRWYWHAGARVRKDPMAVLQAARDWFQEYGETFLHKSPRTYADYCNVGGVAAFQLGFYAEARCFFIRATRGYPWDWKHYLRVLLSTAPMVGRRVWSTK